MNLTGQRAATRDLKRPIVGLVPIEQEGEVRQMTGFVSTAEYGPREAVDGEIGSVENVRYVVSDVGELRYINGEEAEAFIAGCEK